MIKVAPSGGTDYSHEGDTYLIESYGCKIHSRPDDEDLQKARIAFYEKNALGFVPEEHNSICPLCLYRDLISWESEVFR